MKLLDTVKASHYTWVNPEGQYLLCISTGIFSFCSLVTFLDVLASSVFIDVLIQIKKIGQKKKKRK